MSQLLQEYRASGSISPEKGVFPARDTLRTRGLDPKGAPAPPDMKVINPLWPEALPRGELYFVSIPVLMCEGCQARPKALNLRFTDNYWQ